MTVPAATARTAVEGATPYSIPLLPAQYGQLGARNGSTTGPPTGARQHGEAIAEVGWTSMRQTRAIVVTQTTRHRMMIPLDNQIPMDAGASRGAAWPEVFDSGEPGGRHPRPEMQHRFGVDLRDPALGHAEYFTDFDKCQAFVVIQREDQLLALGKLLDLVAYHQAQLTFFDHCRW